jgi:hypothetical protein
VLGGDASPRLFQQVRISLTARHNRFRSAIRNSDQGVAHLVQFPNRKNESVLPDPAFSYSPFLIVPLGQLCSLVFHLLFLIFFTAKLAQPIGIAFENQSHGQLAQQTGHTEPQDGAIHGTEADALMRLYFFHQPSISIIRLLGIDSERGHFTGLLSF